MINNDDIIILTQLIGVGLKLRDNAPACTNVTIPKTKWQRVYDLAQKQGVLAIVFDAISALSIVSQLPNELKYRWIAAVSMRESNYLKQYVCATELSDIFKSQGITTTALKGLSIATYYPVSSHREFGDFDCFLGNDYERGNIIMEKYGAKVERDYYRHSHIYYKGVMIENHQFCVGVRGSNKMKDFERYLRSVIHNGCDELIEKTSLTKPSSDFNALFLISHAMTHFLVEGIKLRHVCDWALLLHNEQDKINWKEFYKWTDELHYTKFANALTAISMQYFGLKLYNDDVGSEAVHCDSIMDDMFYEESIFNKGYGVWKSRIISITNRLKSLWKFKRIYQRSAVVVIFEQVIGFLFDRKPSI